MESAHLPTRVIWVDGKNYCTSWGWLFIPQFTGGFIQVRWCRISSINKKVDGQDISPLERMHFGFLRVDWYIGLSMGFVVDRQILRIHHHVFSKNQCISPWHCVDIYYCLSTCSRHDPRAIWYLPIIMHLYLIYPWQRSWYPFALHWANNESINWGAGRLQNQDLEAWAQCFQRRNQHHPFMDGSMWMSCYQKSERHLGYSEQQTHPATLWIQYGFFRHNTCQMIHSKFNITLDKGCLEHCRKKHWEGSYAEPMWNFWMGTAWASHYWPGTGCFTLFCDYPNFGLLSSATMWYIRYVFTKQIICQNHSMFMGGLLTLQTSRCEDGAAV